MGDTTTEPPAAGERTSRPPRLLLPFAAQLFGAFLLFLVVAGGIITFLWPTIETLVVTESRCFITRSAATVAAAAFPQERLATLAADPDARREDDTLRRLQETLLGRAASAQPGAPAETYSSAVVATGSEGQIDNYRVELSLVAPMGEAWVVLLSTRPEEIGTVHPWGNYLAAYARPPGGWDNFTNARGDLQIFVEENPRRIEDLNRRRAAKRNPPMLGLNSAVDDIVSARPLEGTLDPGSIPAWATEAGLDLGRAVMVATLPHDRAMATVRALKPFFRGLVITACVIALCGALVVTWRMNRPLRQLDAAIARVAEGDLTARVTDVRRHDEFGRVSWQFNRMMEELARGRELSGSLAIASRIQRELIPDPPTDVEGLDIAAWYKPSSDIGGDYYDFIRKDRHLWIVVGDAVGHGVDSGLIMAGARAMVRALIEARDTPAQVMTALNGLLSRDFRNGNFLTCAVLRVDIEGGEACLCSAGHEPVIHVSGPLRTVRVVKSNGPPLGLFEGMEYRDGPTLDLREGDFLVLASDGIRECHNEEKEQFGMDRLTAAVATHAATAGEVVDRLRREVLAFAGDRPVDDDVSLVVVRFHGGQPGSSWMTRRRAGEAKA